MRQENAVTAKAADGTRRGRANFAIVTQMTRTPTLKSNVGAIESTHQMHMIWCPKVLKESCAEEKYLRMPRKFWMMLEFGMKRM